MRSVRPVVMALVLALFAAACTAGAEPVAEKKLADLLLQPDDAPAGTRLNAGDSGEQDLDEYAEDDAQKRKEMEDAGFVTSYFRLFLPPETFSTGKLPPRGTMAIAFGLRFEDDEGAREGAAAVRRSVQRRGKGLTALPEPQGLGDDAFALKGQIRGDLEAQGYLFAWRRGDAVLGVIALGARGVVREEAARALADRQAARGR